MTKETHDPLGYQPGEDTMISIAEAKASFNNTQKAQSVIGTAEHYFKTLEQTAITQYEPLLAKIKKGEQVTLQDTETCEQKVNDASQGELADKLKIEVKMFGVASPVVIGGQLFKTEEGSYAQALNEHYTGLVALAWKGHKIGNTLKNARDATTSGSNEEVLRSLNAYAAEYNSASPQQPIKTAKGKRGQTYAEHFKIYDPKGELAHLLLNAIDNEIANGEPAQFTTNRTVWERLGAIVTRKLDEMYKAHNDLHKAEITLGQSTLKELRNSAMREVTQRTTRLMKVPEHLE